MLTFTKRLNWTLSLVTALALIAMMLHIVANALSRFFFNAPFAGTNELVGFWYLPVVALLGIPAAQLMKEQITVTLVVNSMKDATARYFKAFACMLGALTSVGFVWFGFEKAVDDMEMGSVAGVTDIITWPVHFLVPVVFFLLALLYVFELIAVLQGKADVEPKVEGATPDQAAEPPILWRHGNE